MKNKLSLLILRLVIPFFVVASPIVSHALPGDILFTDDFERVNIAPWTTTNTTTSNIGTQTSNSGTRSLYTRHSAVTTTSPVTDLLGKYAKLNMWIRRGSDAFSENPEGAENLVVEYFNNASNWIELATYTGNGTQGEIFLLDEQLPADALHSGFRVRVRQLSGSGSDYDYWHIDDVIITETGYVPPPPPLGIGSCEYFEGSLSNWTTSTSGGTVTTSGATSLSPTKSLDINGGVASATTIAMDTSSNFKDVTIWIRRGSDTFSEDPDPGEDLFLEYFNSTGSWVNLETFLGSGTDGQIYNRTYPMPAAAKHANFRLRIRMQNGNGGDWDHWHVDDVCLVPVTSYPNITMQKTSSVISDGVNASNPKRIPGAIVEYNISATNAGAGAADNNSVIISDAIPANTALYVNDISGPGTGPVRFVDGSPPSGLSYNFISLASTTDTVSFSNNGGTSYVYTPTPDANGVDINVTHIKMATTGSFLAGGVSGSPNFQFKFRVKVQ